VKISLKACRAECDASAKEVADFVGVDENTVYNWDNGSIPNALNMQKLLEFYSSKGFTVTLNDINFLSRK
jgi:DNA-binding XRE family transcriptional regulator